MLHGPWSVDGEGGGSGVERVCGVCDFYIFVSLNNVNQLYLYNWWYGKTVHQLYLYN